MTDHHEIDSLTTATGAEPGVDELSIPAPRSGSHYELWRAEVDGYHGCLDAPFA